MAWKIVAHALRMIFGNFGQALRVSVGPFALMILATYLLGRVLPVEPSEVSGTQLLLTVGVLALTIFVTSWIAVAWHRFILLEEYTGLLPDITDRPIWPYAAKALLLGLRLMFFLIPAVLLMSGLTQISGNSMILLNVLFSVIVGIGVTYLSLRWGVALPAIALGGSMTFLESWRETAALSNTLIGVSSIVLIITFVPFSILQLAFQGGGFVTGVIGIVMNWFQLMVGVCVLTTLYGQVVEGRALTE